MNSKHLWKVALLFVTFLCFRNGNAETYTISSCNDLENVLNASNDTSPVSVFVQNLPAGCGKAFTVRLQSVTIVGHGASTSFEEKLSFNLTARNQFFKVQDLHVSLGLTTFTYSILSFDPDYEGKVIFQDVNFQSLKFSDAAILLDNPGADLEFIRCHFTTSDDELAVSLFSFQAEGVRARFDSCVMTAMSIPFVHFHKPGFIEFENCTFQDHFFTRDKGILSVDIDTAVGVGSQYSLQIHNSTFVNCSSTGDGPVRGLILYINDVPKSMAVEISSSTFTDLEGDDAAIYSQNAGVLTITSTEFSDNSMRSEGTVTIAAADQLLIQNCNFTKNSAQALGGALSLRADPSTPLSVDYVVSGNVFATDTAGNALGQAVGIIDARPGFTVTLVSNVFRNATAGAVFPVTRALIAIQPELVFDSPSSSFLPVSGGSVINISDCTFDSLDLENGCLVNINVDHDDTVVRIENCRFSKIGHNVGAVLVLNSGRGLFELVSTEFVDVDVYDGVILVHSNNTYRGGGTVRFQNIRFSLSRSSSFPAVFWLDTAYKIDFVFDNVDLVNATANYAAIYAFDLIGNLSISNCDFDNEGTLEYPALDISGGNTYPLVVEISDSKFVHLRRAAVTLHLGENATATFRRTKFHGLHDVAVSLNSEGNVVFEDCIFTAVEPRTSDTCVLCIEKMETGTGTVDIRNSVFAYNTGPAIISRNEELQYTVLSLEGCDFSHNVGGEWGALNYELVNSPGVDLATTHLTVSRTLFFNNTVTGGSAGGGALLLKSPDFRGIRASVIDTTFKANKAELGYGGAIFAYNAELNLTDSQFFSNIAHTRGGGVFCNSGLSTFDSVFFRENGCSDRNNSAGGAVYFDVLEDLLPDAHMVLVNTSVSRNTAGSGSGVYVNAFREFNAVGNSLESPTLTVRNSVFSDNVATMMTMSSIYPAGGALLMEGRLHLLVQNTNITQNVGGTKGGGVFLTGYAIGEDVVFDHTLIEANQVTCVDGVADLYGAGLAFEPHCGNISTLETCYNKLQLNFPNTTIRGNVHLPNAECSATSLSGGGVAVRPGVSSTSKAFPARDIPVVLNFTDTVIASNEAHRGAGVCIEGLGLFSVVSGTVQGNRAVTEGGGLYVLGYSSQLDEGLTRNVTDTIIDDNSAARCGGVSFASANPISNPVALVDTTISHNSATGSGGGICFDSQLNVGGDVAITDNKAGESGGGILVRTSALNPLVEEAYVQYSGANNILSVRSNTAAAGAGIATETVHLFLYTQPYIEDLADLFIFNICDNEDDEIANTITLGVRADDWASNITVCGVGFDSSLPQPNVTNVTEIQISGFFPTKCPVSVGGCSKFTVDGTFTPMKSLGTFGMRYYLGFGSCNVYTTAYYEGFYDRKADALVFYPAQYPVIQTISEETCSTFLSNEQSAFPTPSDRLDLGQHDLRMPYPFSVRSTNLTLATDGVSIAMVLDPFTPTSGSLPYCNVLGLTTKSNLMYSRVYLDDDDTPICEVHFDDPTLESYFKETSLIECNLGALGLSYNGQDYGSLSLPSNTLEITKPIVISGYTPTTIIKGRANEFLLTGEGFGCYGRNITMVYSVLVEEEAQEREVLGQVLADGYAAFSLPSTLSDELQLGNLSVQVTVTGKQLLSNVYNLTISAEYKLELVQNPSPMTENYSPLRVQPIVQLRTVNDEDKAVNMTVPEDVTLEVAVSAQPNPISISGSTVAMESSGRAVFKDLLIHGHQTEIYTLTFSTPGMGSATFTGLTVGECPFILGNSTVQPDILDCVCEAGYWQDYLQQCNPCTIRYYKPEIGNVQCLECPDQYMTTLQRASTQFTDCVCAEGFVAVLKTASSSSSSSLSALSSPLTAMALMAAELEGSGYPDGITPDDVNCMCKSGRYLDPTLQQCLPCPVGTITTTSNLLSECAACPPLATTAGQAMTECECGAGAYVVASEGGGLMCESCPEGGFCAGFGALPTAAIGYYSSDSVSNVFIECESEEACLGNNKCGEGRSGYLCAQCIDGYYRVNNDCLECTDGASLLFPLLIVASLVGSIAFLAYNFNKEDTPMGGALRITINFFQITALYNGLNTAWPESVETLWLTLSVANANLEIFAPACSVATEPSFYTLYFLKLLAPVLVWLSIGLVYLLFRLLTHFCAPPEESGAAEPGGTSKSVEPEDSDGAEMAVFMTPGQKDLESGASSAAVAAAPVDLEASSPNSKVFDDTPLKEQEPVSYNFFQSIWKGRGQKNRELQHNAAIRSIGLATLFLYLPISQTVLEFFDCSESSDGTWLMDTAPNVKCYEGDFYSYMPWAILAIVVFVCGIPVMLFFFVRRIVSVKNQLLAGGDAGEDVALSGPYFQRFVSVFGLLHSRYVAECSQWELIILLRKLAVVAVFLFFNSFNSLQMVAALLVLCVAGFMQLWFKPFVNQRNNYLESACLCCNILTLLVGLGYDEELEDTGEGRVLEILIWLFFALNAFTLLYFVFVHLRNVSDTKGSRPPSARSPRSPTGDGANQQQKTLS